MSFSKTELKRRLIQMGIEVKGNYVKKKDIENALAAISTEGRELELYIDNESDLYEKYKMPVFKNLSAKMKKGAYDPSLAAKAFYPLVEMGAKKYAKEHANPNEWNKIFTPEVRKELASEYVKEFEAAFKNKEYDFMK